MNEASTTDSAKVEAKPSRPHARTKESTELRFRELLGKLQLNRQRIADLELRLSACTQEAEQQKKTLQARDEEVTLLRGERREREEQRKTMPERIAKARDEGRKLFMDFDAVIRGVQLDAPAFETLLASTNGPFLMYTAGLGLGVLQAQAQAKQRVEYYRQLHRQHFAGENRNV